MTPPGRPTVVMKFVNTIIQDIVRIVSGLIAMAAGFWAVSYEVKHPPTPPVTRGTFDIIVLVAGIVFAGLGFLMMPYVFERTQNILIVLFPSGVDVPVLGHLFRRKGDVAPTRTLDEPPPDPKG